MNNSAGRKAGILLAISSLPFSEAAINGKDWPRGAGAARAGAFVRAVAGKAVSAKNAVGENARVKAALEKASAVKTAALAAASEKASAVKTAAGESAALKAAREKASSAKTAIAATVSERASAVKTAAGDSAAFKAAREKASSAKTAIAATVSERASPLKDVFLNTVCVIAALGRLLLRLIVRGLAALGRLLLRLIKLGLAALWKLLRRLAALVRIEFMKALLGKSAHGKGALGEEAYAFVDFLADAGQSYWQILPIGPVGKTLSPYQSRSAFAGNPAYIDWGAVRREPKRYAPKGAPYKKFLRENAVWLDSFALFEAVRASQKGKPLSGWPDRLRNPSAETLTELSEKYREMMETVRFEQYCFFLQWGALKCYANEKGVGIIGDLPIYVYDDSAEFWMQRSIFDVDEEGRPLTSAGVPPDGFSKDGQVWDNPVYDWARHKKEATAFWRERIKQAARLYDGVRIDHFRAFADFYAIPVNCNSVRGNKKAKRSGYETGAAKGAGEWRPGPGKPFINMIKKRFPGLFIIVEDLGDLSCEAKTLVEESGFPGMKVLQFAFSGDPENPYLPYKIPENSVAYTGTHDNDTLKGWLRRAPKEERDFAKGFFGLSRAGGLPKAMIAATLASRADTAIIPMQDWLGLGARARMNRPATVGGRNWKWRVSKRALTGSLSARIRHATKDLFAR